jgi:hypothetical protein
MKTPPPLNYRLPLLATIVSTLLVLTLFAVLAFFTAAWSVRQFTTPSDEGGLGSVVTSGLCGLATLLLIAGIVYFALALIKGVRDLTHPMARLNGYIERKYTGMGRTGGFWIVVQPGERPAVATPTRLATALGPAAGPAGAARPTARGPVVPAAQPAPAPPGDGFGAALEEVARHTRSTTAAPVAPPEPLPPPPSTIGASTARIFRVDKPVYNALRDGEPVTVGYSRFLEHVYYVEHMEAGEAVQLRNTSLI